MRVLLDECVPARVKQLLTGHAVQTVSEVGWRGRKDELLLEVASQRFDVIVTVDRRFANRSLASQFRIHVLIVRLPNNAIDSFRKVRDQLQTAVSEAKPGTVATLWGSHASS